MNERKLTIDGVEKIVEKVLSEEISLCKEG